MAGKGSGADSIASRRGLPLPAACLAHDADALARQGAAGRIAMHGDAAGAAGAGVDFILDADVDVAGTVARQIGDVAAQGSQVDVARAVDVGVEALHGAAGADAARAVDGHVDAFAAHAAQLDVARAVLHRIRVAAGEGRRVDAAGTIVGHVEASYRARQFAFHRTALFQGEIFAIETAGHQAARAGNGDLLQLRCRVDDVDAIAAANVRIAPDAQGIAAHFAVDARLQVAVRFDHQRCCRPHAHVDLDIDALHVVDVERVDIADLAHVAAHLFIALDGIAARVRMAHFAIVGVDDDGATAEGNGTAQGQQGTHGVSFMIVLVQDKK